jgi:ABC-type nickel/cobalt efflux system permease component RcnA
MRLELPLAVAVNDPRRVEIRDLTYTDFPGLVGIKVGPGTGTTVRVREDTSDPTDNLRSYEEISRADIPSNRRLSLTVRPGPGIARGPDGELLKLGPPEPPESSPGDSFTQLFEDAAQGEGVFIAFLLAAFAWGSLHALSPGHGKAMVAAYLIGTRGTPRHALALGGIVTATHTIGVFALGLVTLLLAQFILPEDLYPWLNLAAGLLIVGVGIGVLRSRIRWATRNRAGETDGPPPGPDQGHPHPPNDHDHGHSHRHHHPRGRGEHDPQDVTWPGLLGMGVSAGLIPCPSALVVLLAAISQHQIGLGLVLIVAFSLGLATTLTALGLSVVYAKRIGTRIASPRVRSSAIVRALPLASNLVILALGLVLTVNALPDVI